MTITHFFGYFATYMKKGNVKYKIFKAVLLILCTPVIIFLLLVMLLYLPPVQQYAIEAVCHEASSRTGYEIRTGAFQLLFPLKVGISDFEVKKGDTIYASGKSIEARVSPLSLLKGEIEIDYLSLEKTKVNTSNLIPDIMLQGEIGYFRAVARNIDPIGESANIRQLHLHSTDIYIEIADTAKKEKEESTPSDWKINLHHGTINKSRIRVGIPSDTLTIEAGIGKLGIREAIIDLGEPSYALKSLSMNDCDAKYDQGTDSQRERPADHIAVNNINLDCRETVYTPDSTLLNIKDLAFVQPDGITITGASFSAMADRHLLDIKELSVKSRNGSLIKGNTILPWSTLRKGSTADMRAWLSAALNRKDLSAFLTAKEYESLSMLGDRPFEADIKIHGNVSNMEIDTISLSIPSVADIHANGNLKEITDTEKLEAALNLDCCIHDIRKITGVPLTDSISNVRVDIGASMTYIAGEANIEMELHGAGGEIGTKATYDIGSESYNATATVNSINIASIMPDIPLESLTMNLKAEGEGADIFNSMTKYGIAMKIDTAVYAGYRLNDITLNAIQENSISDITLQTNDRNLNLELNAHTRLDSADIRNKTTINIAKADFKGLGLSEAEFGSEMDIEFTISTDMSESHSLNLTGKNIKITAAGKRFTPKEISTEMATAPHSTYITAKNGDLSVSGKMDCGYNGLFASLEKLGRMYSEASSNHDMIYFLHDYEKAMPEMTFDFKCGKQNMLANYLAFNGMSTDNISLKLKLDTIQGLNIEGGVYGFRDSAINLDTVRIFTRQEGEKVRYLARVRSTSVNPDNEKQTFNAALYGNICMDSLSTNFVFRDKKEGVGIKIGATTLMKPRELSIHFNPNAILLGEKFSFNRDNRIRLNSRMNIEADVTLENDSNGGLRLHTNPDPTAQYNATLEIFNVNLKRLTETLPFAPDISGTLNLDLFFKKDGKGILISSDIKADDVAYEGTYIGNEAVEVAYFPKEKNVHSLNILLRHNDRETARLSGDYTDETDDPGLNGSISIDRFPLDITKAFIKGSGVDFTGYINGELKAEGRLSGLKTNGHIQFDSVYMDAPLAGTTLRMPDEYVRIEDNVIRFNNFNILAKGNTPFNVNGTVDMNRLSDPALDIRMNASNYKLVDSPRKRGNMLYGKMFVDFRSFIGGTVNNMKVRGNMTLLGNSNITYVMQDTPIESDKELDGLVEFVNFKDTTNTAPPVEEEIDLGNTDINLTLNIEEGARINADFDENRNSYLMLQGGGNLHMTYTDETGINVTGTYSMSDGQLKYALPVIPLKTFNIVDGSKITWTGNLFNPEVDITALERITTSVTFDDNSMQPVMFDVGVKLSNSLSNMGLSFTMSAPENAMIQDNLKMLDPETLNKYAVTMLITGTYIGNSKGMTISNALSSFLDAKINDLTGSAMKSVDVNVGINDAQNAETGSTYKNYSFSFSKRFWNDRLTIVIGGEVNSGDHPTGDNSFINNVSLEWKISDKGNRYLRLFYDKNYESLLEGEIVETGIGYVYKRKLNTLNELLIFKRKEDKEEPHPAP